MSEVRSLVGSELRHRDFKGNSNKYYARAQAFVRKGFATALLNNEKFVVDGKEYHGYEDAIFFDLD